MNGQQTDPKTAAAAVVMSRSGYGTSAISRLLETPLGTVKDIIAGRNGWDRIHQQAWFQEYCTTYRATLRASLTEITKKALIRVDETVDEASPGGAMWIAAVAIDKTEKLDNQSMDIPDEPFTKEKWDSDTTALEMVHAELGRRIQAAKVIEVEKVPEGNGTPETP